MATWNLITPYGTIVCHKGRSFGEFVWKQPDPDRKFGVAYFSTQGHPLERDVFVHIRDVWIPRKGNAAYAARMYYRDWVAAGKPKTIDGRKIGIVVKRMNPAEGATISWDARKKLKLSQVDIHRLVTKEMKFIIPEPENIDLYRQVVHKLDEENVILLTDKVALMKNTTTYHRYAVLPIGQHLIYVEILDEDLQRPFPPDATIPSDQPQEIGEVEEEDVGDII